MSDAFPSGEQTFRRALALVLGFEGGVSRDPADAGGLTVAGVTEATWRQYLDLTGQQLYRPVTASTPDERTDCYRTMYWAAGRCERLPEPVAVTHFDGNVNHGPGTAARILQAVVGVEVDGDIGAETIRAVNVFPAMRLAHDLVMARRGFYVACEIFRPLNHRFEAGWQHRMDKLEKAIGC